MSSPGVSNPIPKDTKTVNDMFSSQDSGVYKASKPLEMRRLGTNNGSVKQNLNNSNYDSSYHDNPVVTDYDSGTTK